jgi:hypothetical protein
LDCFNTFIHTLANVGGWPQSDNILRITRIVVYAGPTFIDSVEITYLLTGGPLKTVVHGGIPAGPPSPALDHTLTRDYTSSSGDQNLLTDSLVIAANQKLVAVYGRRLNAPGEFGKSKYVLCAVIINIGLFKATGIVQLSFVFATSGTGTNGTATCTVLSMI